MHGWIILDKPLGLGSTQAVSAVKRALRTGGYPKLKVGHGGTLDPLASGVLPVAIGEATKLAGRLLDSDKVYEFTIRFGEQTDTLDAEGEIIASSDVRPSADQMEAILPRFTGSIEQIPPAFSALKVDGERAYDLARAGSEVELGARRVTVHDLRVFASSREQNGFARSREDAKEELESITLSAHVSKGTYIRSLARDIAQALGTVGHVTILRRTKAGPFTLDHAISLDKLDDLAKGHALEQVLLPLRAGLDDIPALSLTPDQAGLLRNGQQLVGIAAPDGQCFAMLGSTPVALAEAKSGTLRVVRGFNL
ncbi:tRNA pseudouridine synthase B [Sphingomonas changbaiensis NBRC 104936]|uniref:tRNA pseudouridine synthase B n=1 Tax=Sphingomonas changbaiensis NBRC 104936 TaxID=1219043 RepID=A0A0E9MPN0_9SPHN|nr:tRNA pseudouridine(55) synthase TruB [Sphingomonas changbaiensis]GAO39085.1 tRNA pseudouridine synthase B [Sphingomonas changbaiensis NBRC 104936]